MSEKKRLEKGAGRGVVIRLMKLMIPYLPAIGLCVLPYVLPDLLKLLLALQLSERLKKAGVIGRL